MELTIDLPCVHFSPGLQDRPLRAVDHDRHAIDVRLGGDQVQEARHHGFAVQQGVVHVHVDHAGAGFHLLARNGHRLVELLFANQAGEAARTRDVRPLAHHDEVGVRTKRQRLLATQTREPFDLVGTRRGARPWTVRAISSMNRGVVPQQPPTMFSQPCSANSRSVAAICRASGRNRRIRSASPRWDDN